MDLLALLIFGFIFGFMLAFGIGANDVANTFGTTIGSGATTIVKGFIIASFAETLGAVLLGGGVAKAISKGVLDVNLFKDDPQLLMLGYLSALIAGTLWLVAASLLKLPVSGTQASVGAMVGMGVVVFGFDAVQWDPIVKIILSWIISPVLSGVISAIMFLALKGAIFWPRFPGLQLARAALLIPLFYGVSIAFNVFASLFKRPLFLFGKSSPILEWQHIELPWYPPVIIGCGLGLLSAVLIAIFYIPRKKAEIIRNNTTIAVQLPKRDIEMWSANPVPLSDSKDAAAVQTVSTVQTVELNPSQFESAPNEHGIRRFIFSSEWRGLDPLFWVLQIITSFFAALAHGGNDVANAVAPLTGMWIIYQSNGTSIPGKETPIETWILLIGGVGITIGLWALGRRVVETIGKNLTEITPPKGFVIELGTSITVLFANQFKIPVSTTFCEVGSVVFVGLCNGKNEISWKLVAQVFMAWVFTLPVTAALSAGIMALLRLIFYS